MAHMTLEDAIRLAKEWQATTDERDILKAQNDRLRALNAELVAMCEAVIALPRSQAIGQGQGWRIPVSLPQPMITQIEALIAKAKAECGAGRTEAE